MLKLFTDEHLVTMKYIHDVEAVFNLNEPLLNELYFDEDSVHALKKIEGMTDRNGKYVTTKYGTILLSEISTGCKAVLLAINNANYLVDSDEMGYNALTVLEEIARTKDVSILVHRVLGILPQDAIYEINGDLCDGADVPLALEYLLEGIYYDL